MPVHETDRTDDFRRKSLETSSQVSALGQSYMPKDRTSGLPDDESHHVIEQSHDYHDQTYVASHDNESKDRDLEGGRHPSAKDVQIFEERSETRSKANQDSPLSEEQMNALTRDLREQPISGMGNERQSEDLSTGEQARTDNLSTENQPLVEEQINSLAQDLKEQMNILAHDLKEQMNAMARDLKEQPTIGSGNQKRSVELSTDDQVQINKYDMKTEQLGEEQMNALTRDLREQPISGMGNERQSEDLSTGNQTQTDKLDTETVTVQKSTDLGNAPLRYNQSTIEKSEHRETKCGAADEPSCERQLIDTRCKGCNENYQPCDFHDRSEDVEEATATSSVKSSEQASSNLGEYPEFNDDDKSSLAAGFSARSEERKAQDIQPANNSSSSDGTELESVRRSAQTEQSTADSQMDKGERKPEIFAVEETRVERKSQPAAERPAKTDVVVEQSTAPSASREQTTDVKKDLKVKSEKDEQLNAATVETTKVDAKPASTSSDNKAELEEKSLSASRQELKDGEMEAAESQYEDGSEKSYKRSFAPDDPRVEHVDRNRETRALHKTNEALEATVHKLTYEAKHLAKRIKDSFTKKRHHEVEIWPDGVVVGEEPENQPAPTEYIKAAHDVVVDFNERAADDFEGERKDSSSSDETSEPAEKNASEMKEAEERRTEAARAPQPKESDKSFNAKQPSETVAIESRSTNIAKEPTRATAESKKDDQAQSEQSVEVRSVAPRKDEQSRDTTETAEHEGGGWSAVKEMVDHKEFSGEQQVEQNNKQSSSPSGAVNREKVESVKTEIKSDQPSSKAEDVTSQKAALEKELMGDKATKSEKEERPSEETKPMPKSTKKEASENSQQSFSALQSNKEVKEDAGDSSKAAEINQSDADQKSNDGSDSGNGEKQPAFTPCNPTDLPECERAAFWDNLEQEASKRVNELAKNAKPMKIPQAEETADNGNNKEEKKEIRMQESSSQDVKETGDINEKLKEKEAAAAAKEEDSTKESPAQISEENLQSPAADDEGTEPADRASTQKTVTVNSEKEGQRMSSSAAKQSEEIKESEMKEPDMEANNTERASMKTEQRAMDTPPPTEDRREHVEETESTQSTSANTTDNAADLPQGKVAAVETTILRITKRTIMQ
uniref:Uncharacterized protein n=1 Tax=Plectus sambesii TaxID=2011161 RepID=A0A914W2Z5_9BILA